MVRLTVTARLRYVKREKTTDGDGARFRTVKRDRISKSSGGDRKGGVEAREEEERLRSKKRDPVSRTSGHGAERRRRVEVVEEEEEEEEEDDETVETTRGGATARRDLLSRYMAVKNVIHDDKDDLTNVDSDKFRSMIREVDNLHMLVQKPREQVADAEALFGICSTLVTSVKSHSNGGLTPKDFIAGLIGKYSNHNNHQAEDAQVLIDWKVVCTSASKLFRSSNGCCTMLGPMDTEIKQRKQATRTRRSQPGLSIQPEEMHSKGDEERTDTDKNMLTMFNILRKNKFVRFEQLILNRKSFAQTVENLFALSFLVKDGRAQVTVEGNNSHFISPKNAPAANLVLSKEVAYSHFILRLDFNDWKLMTDIAPDGEDLMPHRNQSDDILLSQEQPPSQPVGTQEAYPTTPIRKHSRNRGITIQETSFVEETPAAVSEDTGNLIRKGKRKLI